MSIGVQVAEKYFEHSSAIDGCDILGFVDIYIEPQPWLVLLHNIHSYECGSHHAHQLSPAVLNSFPIWGVAFSHLFSDSAFFMSEVSYIY